MAVFLVGDDAVAAVVIPAIGDVVSCLFQARFGGWPFCLVAIGIANAQKLAQFLFLFCIQWNPQIDFWDGRQGAVIEDIEFFQIAAITASDLNLRFFFLCVDDDVVDRTECVDGCFGTSIDDDHIVFIWKRRMRKDVVAHSLLLIVQGMILVVDAPDCNSANAVSFCCFFKDLHFGNMTDIHKSLFCKIELA